MINCPEASAEPPFKEDHLLKRVAARFFTLFSSFAYAAARLAAYINTAGHLSIGDI